MKSLRRFGIFFLALFFTALAPQVGSAASIHFDGPKLTTEISWNGQVSPMIFVGDFDVDALFGEAPLDLVVPVNGRLLGGFANLNTWNTPGPNSYFSSGSVTSGSSGIQSLVAAIDGNAASDVVNIVNGSGRVDVCYDFSGPGSTCAGGVGSANASVHLYEHPNLNQNILQPVAAETGDFDGNGRTDVAVLTMTPDFRAYLIVLINNGAGGVSPFAPYTPILVQDILPISIAAADFNHDGMTDVAVAGSSLLNLTEARMAVLLNTGHPAPTMFDQEPNENMTYSTCNFPTGLEVYDPNGDNYPDLVMTCSFMIVAGQVRGGPVYSLRNEATTGRSFAVEQHITRPGEPGLLIPTRSAVGDVNGDSLVDLVVAEWGGQALRVYPGTAPFQFNMDEVNVLQANPYVPTYVELADMNGDTRLDIVSASRSNFINYYYQYQAGDAQTTGEFAQLCLTPEAAAATQGETLVATRATLEAVSGAAPLQVVEQTLQNSGDGSRVVAQPASASLQVNRTAVLVIDQDDAPLYNGNATLMAPEDFVPCDGILVYLNSDPGVFFGDVNCDSQSISYTCVAPEGKTIESCVASSAEIAIEGTPAEAPGWSGTVNIPNSPKDFSLSVTATYTDGTQYVGELQVNLSQCPSGSGSNCPEKLIEKHVFDQEYFSLCAGPQMSQKALSGGGSIVWRQTHGEKIIGLGPTEKYEYKNVNVGGPCIDGVIKSQSWFTTKGYDFEYGVANAGGEVTTWCPAKLIHSAPGVEGSGTCALNSQLRVTPLSLAMGLMLGLMPLAWSISKRRLTLLKVRKREG